MKNLNKKETKYIDLKKFIQDEYATTFILGARGVGKTINAFVYMIENFKRDKKLGIYLRRYLTEIETSAIDFKLIGTLTDTEITREKININGVMYDMILVDGEPCIYMLALSVVGKYKSSAFTDVDIIIYDEFIDLKDRELKNETTLYLQFAMTVFRDFTKYKALFLANNTNIFNNYFLDFEVLPKSKVTKFRDKSIKIVTYKTSQELDEEREKTPLAGLVNLVEGVDNSSLDNKPSGSFEDFIRPLNKNAKYLYTYKLKKIIFGVYRHGNYMIISSKYDPNFKKVFALTFDDVSETIPILEFEDYTILRNMFLNGLVFFTDVKTRSLFIRRFKKAGFITDY